MDSTWTFGPVEEDATEPIMWRVPVALGGSERPDVKLAPILEVDPFFAERFAAPGRRTFQHRPLYTPAPISLSSPRPTKPPDGPVRPRPPSIAGGARPAELAVPFPVVGGIGGAAVGFVGAVGATWLGAALAVLGMSLG